MPAKSYVFEVTVLLLVSIVLTLPAFTGNEIVRGHDGAIHLRWQHAFATALWNGNFYPRWLADLNDGFGSPAFFVYPPLSHFLAALTYPLAPTGTRLALSLTAAIFLGAVGTFFWLRHHAATSIGPLIGAIAYSVAPYHLFVDVYLRGAFAEVWAFAPIPFALLAVDHLSAHAWRPFVGLTVALACLILLHAPSIFIAVPAIGLYAIMSAWKQQRVAPLSLFLLAGITAALLSGAYLGTALTQVGLIRSEQLFAGRFVPTNWLIGGGMWPDIELQHATIVATATQVGLSLALGLLIGLHAGWRTLWLRARYVLVLLVASLFMTTVLSAPIWELETPLNRIQFPWRILSLQAIVVAWISCLAFDPDARRKDIVISPGKVAVLLVGLMLAVNGVLYAGMLWIDVRTGYGMKSVEQALAENRDAAEYRLGNLDTLGRLFADGARFKILSGRGDIEVSDWAPRRFVLTSDSPEPLRVAVRQFSHTGWSYGQRDGEDRRAETLSPDRPVVVITIPAGKQTTVAVMRATPEETMGLMASASGALALVLSGYLLQRRSRRFRPAGSV